MSPSPTLNVFYAHHPLVITCDSGATSSLIRLSLAQQLDIPILPTNHRANQADGKTTMDACGEVHITVTKGTLSLNLEAVVVKDLDCEILGGVPFMKSNNIILDLPGESIVIAGKKFPYSIRPLKSTTLHVRQSSSFLLRPAKKEVILPGDYIELRTPTNICNDPIAIEPRYDIKGTTWIQPLITQSVDGIVRVPNLTLSPVSVSKHQHLAQAYFTTTTEELDSPSENVYICAVSSSKKSSTLFHSSAVDIDPDNQLTSGETNSFIELNKHYDYVFNSSIGCYNDASGHLRAYINMGPVAPPPRKARLPSYSSDKMHLLQQKMDELEHLGVLARPEDVDVTIEHVSPSFLIKKQDGSHRLVTAFSTIGTYAKPIISKSTSTDDILRFLAKFKYIIKSDMTKQFFQLPIKKSSMKYLGVITPYKGLRVYTRAAMGMPGSTEHLDELMSRVLGDLIEQGIVKKIADDLYTGGNTIKELLLNWESILQAFEKNNLRLSASKTVICPVTTTILGWIWSAGRIAPSPHKVTPLATSSPPKTVKGLRSWIGAFKHLKVCVPRYSDLLSALETATGGKESRETVQWTDSLLTSFTTAQNALSDIKQVTVPRPSDKLIITTDGSVGNCGIGAVLYVTRNGKMLVGGYFSAKLKPHQRKWLPCEIEALAISAAISHWAPFIIDSMQTTQILTDSRPCVQAFDKMSLGQFSTSARISTFLSVLSRYNVSLQYIPGNMNLPADYQSRNPMECTEKRCQICSFLSECETSSVFNISVSDILDGKCNLPFLSPVAWKAAQHDCPSLRRTYSHLTQGTRPTKKDTHIRDVKRYLGSCTVGRNSLIVHRKTLPFCPARELTVIPRHLLAGLLTALHIRINHPTKTQMKKMFDKFFYALDSDKEIDKVCSNCPQCSSLATLPKEVESFTTTDVQPSLGSSFASDIMRRSQQYIFVLRDTFSSFTVAKIIPDEKAVTLKSALIELSADLKSPAGCSVRVDSATSFQSLCKDPQLAAMGITFELGRPKNPNKNPVAEKAVQELEKELRRSYPEGDPVSQSQLAVVTATLNMRVRNRGLSAREIVYQRDPHTGEQLQISDKDLANEQHLKRLANHHTSAISQSSGRPAKDAPVQVGNLIYIKREGNKHLARELYIVTETKKDFLCAQKLTQSQVRAKKYELKYDEVFLVPTQNLTTNPLFHEKSMAKNNISVIPNNDSHTHSNHLLDPAAPCVPDYPYDSDSSSCQSDPSDLALNDQSADASLPQDKFDSLSSVQQGSSGLRRSHRVTKRPGYLDDYALDIDSLSS